MTAWVTHTARLCSSRGDVRYVQGVGTRNSCVHKCRAVHVVITARRYALRVLVIVNLSVCLSVTLVDCNDMVRPIQS